MWLSLPPLLPPLIDVARSKQVYIESLEITALSIYLVARSRQVYMKWLWKHCLLLSILPG
jgi:hypothetical protein